MDAPDPGSAPETGSLEDILAAKKAKIAQLRERGIDPYPPRSLKTHSCAEALSLGAALTGSDHSAPDNFDARYPCIPGGH